MTVRSVIIKKNMLCVMPILFMFWSCGDKLPEPNNKISVGNGIAVVTAASDYSASNFEIIDVNSYDVVNNLIPYKLHDDIAVRTNGSDIYILERYLKDNIIKYDAKEMKIEYQKPVAGFNIHDIAVISRVKAYVSCNGSKDLMIINPETGDETGRIDIYEFSASGQPHPFASAMAVYGSYLYVACQRLDAATYAPADTSLIAVIDTRADEIVGRIALEKRNPASMAVFQDRLLVASSGDFANYLYSGVEMIDLLENRNLGVVAEGDFFATDAVFVSRNKAYFCAMSTDWSVSVYPLDLSSRSVSARIGGINDASGGMVYYMGKVYVGNRDFGAAGVAVVDPNTDAVERTIQTGMPPCGLSAIFAD